MSNSIATNAVEALAEILRIYERGDDKSRKPSDVFGPPKFDFLGAATPDPLAGTERTAIVVMTGHRPRAVVVGANAVGVAESIASQVVASLLDEDADVAFDLAVWPTGGIPFVDTDAAS